LIFVEGFQFILTKSTLHKLREHVCICRVVDYVNYDETIIIIVLTK